MLSRMESGSADLAPSDLCSAGSKSTEGWEATASGLTEAVRSNITERRVVVLADMTAHSALMSRVTSLVSWDQLSILRHSNHQFHFPRPAERWANTRTSDHTGPESSALAATHRLWDQERDDWERLEQDVRLVYKLNIMINDLFCESGTQTGLQASGVDIYYFVFMREIYREPSQLNGLINSEILPGERIE